VQCFLSSISGLGLLVCVLSAGFSVLIPWMTHHCRMTNLQGAADCSSRTRSFTQLPELPGHPVEDVFVMNALGWNQISGLAQSRYEDTADVLGAFPRDPLGRFSSLFFFLFLFPFSLVANVHVPRVPKPRSRARWYLHCTLCSVPVHLVADVSCVFGCSPGRFPPRPRSSLGH
jgi:hypothetical protein